VFQCPQSSLQDPCVLSPPVGCRSIWQSLATDNWRVAGSVVCSALLCFLLRSSNSAHHSGTSNSILDLKFSRLPWRLRKHIPPKSVSLYTLHVFTFQTILFFFSSSIFLPVDNDMRCTYFLLGQRSTFRVSDSCGKEQISTELDTIKKTTNAHKCMKVYFTHRIPPTCFGQSCGHLEGSALRRIDTRKYYRSISNLKFKLNF
jgi:hypothetical protein